MCVNIQKLLSIKISINKGIFNDIFADLALENYTDLICIIIAVIL